MPSSRRGSLPSDLQTYRIEVLIFRLVCFKYSLFGWLRNSVEQQNLAFSICGRLIMMYLIIGHYHVLLNPCRLKSLIYRRVQGSFINEASLIRTHRNEMVQHSNRISHFLITWAFHFA